MRPMSLRAGDSEGQPGPGPAQGTYPRKCSRGSSHPRACAEKSQFPPSQCLLGQDGPGAPAGRVGKPFSPNMRGVFKENIEILILF